MLFHKTIQLYTNNGQILGWGGGGIWVIERDQLDFILELNNLRLNLNP